jgi:hypothetical protein
MTDKRKFNSGVQKPKNVKKTERFPLIVPYQFLSEMELLITGKRSDFFRNLLLQGAACQSLAGHPTIEHQGDRHYVSIRVNPEEADLIRSRRMPQETITGLTRRLIIEGLNNDFGSRNN